jgi:hypothetical protein
LAQALKMHALPAICQHITHAGTAAFATGLLPDGPEVAPVEAEPACGSSFTSGGSQSAAAGLMSSSCFSLAASATSTGWAMCSAFFLAHNKLMLAGIQVGTLHRTTFLGIH